MSTSEDRGSQLGRSAVQQAPMRDGQGGTACDGDPRDLSFHPPPGRPWLRLEEPALCRPPVRTKKTHMSSNDSIRPFGIDIPEESLQELRRRVAVPPGPTVRPSAIAPRARSWQRYRSSSTTGPLIMTGASSRPS